jgi:hypothetical protein
MRINAEVCEGVFDNCGLARSGIAEDAENLLLVGAI